MKEKIIKWMGSFTNVQQVQVDRETDNFVFLGERREAKKTDWRCYFNSREEAVEYVIKEATAKRDRMAQQLANAESEFQKCLAYRQPTEPTN